MLKITDFQLSQLRALPIEGVAGRLGLTPTRHISLCPFHDDRHPSLHFNVNKHSHKCYVCDAHGGPIDLVMNHLRLSFVEACRWLSDDSNIILSEYANTQTVEKKTYRFDPSRYLRYFERPYLSPAARAFLYDERHLDPRVIRWCRITSWQDRGGNNWLQTPYYDADGNLTGIQWRHLVSRSNSSWTSQAAKPSAKFQVPIVNFVDSCRDSAYFKQVWSALAAPRVPSSNSSWTSQATKSMTKFFDERSGKADYLDEPSGKAERQVHGTGASPMNPVTQSIPRFRFPKGSKCNIYNLQILPLLKPGEPLYIAEGCSDCWSLLSAGHKAIAIPSATTLHESELLKVFKRLGELHTCLHIYPDQDIPGEKLYLQLTLLSAQAGLTLIRHSLPQGCKDFSDYYLAKRQSRVYSVKCIV